MSYKYGPKSISIRGELHPLLTIVFDDVLTMYDHALICGFRGKVDQNLAFNNNKSGLQWPESSHNHKPALAVDVIPYPSLYKSEDEFFKLSKIIKYVAKLKGVKLNWGGDWSRMVDLPHWEIDLNHHNIKVGSKWI